MKARSELHSDRCTRPPEPRVEAEEGLLKLVLGKDAFGLMASNIGFSDLKCFPLEEHKRVIAVPFCQRSSMGVLLVVRDFEKLTTWKI